MKKLYLLFPLFCFIATNCQEKNCLDLNGIKNQSQFKKNIKILNIEKKIISWKTLKMPKLLIDTLDIPLPNMNNSTIEWVSSKYICLRSSCGSPCWASYLFPIINGDKVKSYFYTLGFDLQRSIVVYQPVDLEQQFMFVIENFQSGKKIKILRNNCVSDLTFLCIDKITFKRDEIIVKWKKAFFEENNLYLRDSNYRIKIDSLLYHFR